MCDLLLRSLEFFTIGIAYTHHKVISSPYIFLLVAFRLFSVASNRKVKANWLKQKRNLLDHVTKKCRDRTGFRKNFKKILKASEILGLSIVLLLGWFL